MLKSRATLIRRHLLGETSLIVGWCARDHGLVRTAAKGARGPKSPFNGKLDLFFDAEIAWTPARRGDLHTLREVVLLAPRLGLRASYPRTLAAAYFTALLELVAEPEAPVPDLHDLLDRALGWLCTSDPSVQGVLRFEDRVAALLGLSIPGVAGAGVLLDSYHRLPPQRQTLFAQIAARE